METVWPIWLIPILPALAALVNGLFGRKLRGASGWVAVGAMTCSLALSLWTFASTRAVTEPIVVPGYTWITLFAGTLSIEMSLLVDHLTCVMLLIVSFVGLLVFVYSLGYMKGDPGVARFFAYMSLFASAMFLLVLGGNFLVLFIGWEGVGLCSYLLIGFYMDKGWCADAGKKAFIVNRMGDFGFLLGMFLVFWSFGSLDFLEVFSADPHELESLASAGVITAICLLLFVGATGKSAQIPLFVWLPDAMAGPTPVSALIHAATMVTAGVYMVARCNVLFSFSPTALAVVAGVGAATAFVAATIGLTQRDIKKVLAYSTVSQLGFMFMALGAGAYAAGIFHVFTHAFFKGCLFLCAGSVIHAMAGEQDIVRMGGLRKWMPVTWLTYLVSTLAIVGVFPFAGFFSKDEILWKTFTGGSVYYQALWGVGMLAALMTSIYMFRSLFLTFHGSCRADDETRRHLHESPPSMTLPLIVLACGAATVGLLGVPEALGGHNQFHHYLDPITGAGARAVASLSGHGDVHAAAEHAVEHVSHSFELGLMAFSLCVALIGIAVAYMLFLRNWPAWPTAVARAFGWFGELSARRWWWDDLYHRFIANGVVALAWLTWQFDKWVIDGVIVGAAWLSRGTSDALRRAQLGRTQGYAMAMFVGLNVLLLVYLLWSA